jgi:superfamily II DNA or RNA helicase
MNLERYRPGQLLAHQTLKQRVIAARDISAMTREELESSISSRYTALVLPTRYGKSDVIRCSAIELYRLEEISAALVLSPNRILRDQLVDKPRVNEMFKRYRITGASRLPYRALEIGPADLLNLTPNREFLLSATIQLVNEHVPFFEHWVDHMLYQHHAPVIVYVDEAHTGSELNTWGETVHRLVRRGAHACLLTATPFRADGRRIPGFDFETVETKQIKVYKRRPCDDQPGYVNIDLFEGCSTRLKLKAHRCTNFKEAWDESPTVLCRISRLPFDVNVLLNKKECLLSELSETDTRQALGKIVRAADVIRKGTQSLVEQVHAIRQLQRDCAAIVFVGNDQADDPKANAHAHRVREHIEAIDASLDVVIATTSEGNEATQNIERFAKGRGDILIVKQMASLGLDVPRLKIALDLSSIRTPAAYIQRIMRIATPYERLHVGILIVPDDCLQYALFQTLIEFEGGEARADELLFVKSYKKPITEDEQRSLFIEGIADADFDDSHGMRADAILRPEVDQLAGAFPQLLTFMSHAQIADKLSQFGITLGQRVETSINTGVVIQDLGDEITETIKELVLRDLGGSYNPTSDRERYALLIRQRWNDAKVRAGIPLNVELEQVTDIAQLRRLKAVTEQMTREHVR